MPDLRHQSGCVPGRFCRSLAGRAMGSHGETRNSCSDNDDRYAGVYAWGRSSGFDRTTLDNDSDLSVYVVLARWRRVFPDCVGKTSSDTIPRCTCPLALTHEAISYSGCGVCQRDAPMAADTRVRSRGSVNPAACAAGMYATHARPASRATRFLERSSCSRTTSGSTGASLSRSMVPAQKGGRSPWYR